MKQYVSVKRPAKGPRVVTVSLVDDYLSSRYSVAVFSTIAQAVKEAYNEALKNLEETREALALVLDEVAA